MERLGTIFLNNKNKYLSDYGFDPDPGEIITKDNNVIFYHYTREEHVDDIMHNGLYARRQVVCPNVPDEYKGKCLVEGFLSPNPMWLKSCPYFGDLGYVLSNKYIGDICLEITLPLHSNNIYVADYAHILENKHYIHRKSCPLNLGYNRENGRETNQAYVHSYIKIKEYNNQHVSPVVQVLTEGRKTAVSAEHIKILDKVISYDME